MVNFDVFDASTGILNVRFRVDKGLGLGRIRLLKFVKVGYVNGS